MPTQVACQRHISLEAQLCGSFNATVPVETQTKPEASPPGRNRVAYIILAHQRPESVARLVRRPYAADHGFFIHYDLNRSAADFQQLVTEFATVPNVYFLKRHKCRWGNAGIVMGMLEGIAELARQKFIYDYAIQLSGQDYPIKSDAEIRGQLTMAAGRSFMESTSWPMPDWENGRAIKRIENYHLHLPVPPWLRKLGWQPMWQHLTIPMKRKIPGDLHPHFGSAFWCLHRSCLKWIHDYVTEHPEYVRFFQPALLPEECFFQTLLMNSPFAASMVGRTLTDIVWRPPWPGIMTMADLPRLQQSDCLFARKFDPAVDAKIMETFDSRHATG